MDTIKYNDIFDENLLRDIRKLIKHLKVVKMLIKQIEENAVEGVVEDCNTKQGD